MVLVEVLEVIMIQLHLELQEVEVLVIHRLSVHLKEGMVVMVLLVTQARRAQLLQREVEVLQLLVVKVQLAQVDQELVVLVVRVLECQTLLELQVKTVDQIIILLVVAVELEVAIQVILAV